jgi:hypothetical protein
MVAPSGVRKRPYPEPWARKRAEELDCPTLGSKISGRWLRTETADGLAAEGLVSAGVGSAAASGEAGNLAAWLEDWEVA